MRINTSTVLLAICAVLCAVSCVLADVEQRDTIFCPALCANRQCAHPCYTPDDNGGFCKPPCWCTEDSECDGGPCVNGACALPDPTPVATPTPEPECDKEPSFCPLYCLDRACANPCPKPICGGCSAPCACANATQCDGGACIDGVCENPVKGDCNSQSDCSDDTYCSHTGIGDTGSCRLKRTCYKVEDCHNAHSGYTIPTCWPGITTCISGRCNTLCGGPGPVVLPSNKPIASCSAK